MFAFVILMHRRCSITELLRHYFVLRMIYTREDLTLPGAICCSSRSSRSPKSWPSELLRPFRAPLHGIYKQGQQSYEDFKTFCLKLLQS